jgi:hypothetical protein
MLSIPEPEYRQVEFMLYAMLKNKHWGKEDASWNADQDVSGKRPEKRPEKRPDKQSEIQMRAQKIVKLLSEDPSLSRPAMCEKLELTDRQVRTALDYKNGA